MKTLSGRATSFSLSRSGSASKRASHGLARHDPPAISRGLDLPRPRPRLLDRRPQDRSLQPRIGHGNPARGRPHRADARHHLRQREGDLLPDVPLCRGLRRRSRVLSRLEERRGVPGDLRGRAVRGLPRGRVRGGEGPRLRRGPGRRPSRRLPDHLRAPRHRRRGHEQARDPGRREEAPDRRHARGLCGHVHLRHGRVGLDPVLAGPRLVGGNVEAACKEYEATMARPSQSAELKLVARGQPASLTDMILGVEAVGPHPETALHLGGEKMREGRTFGALALAPEVDRTVAAGGPVLTLVEPRRAGRGGPGSAGLSLRMSDILFVGTGVTIGAFVGALAIKVGEVPLSLSTSGGALIAGLVFSWLRSVRPSFGAVPEPILWMMNSVGLNIFMAVVGINSGPGFVTGLREAGVSLFLAGILVTTIPLLVGLLVARYVFRFHPGIALGCVAGARTTGAALGAVQDVVQSKVPALGYTVTYAVGNTILTIWGIVIVILMT